MPLQFEWDDNNARVAPVATNGNSMKKAPKKPEADMAPEYDGSARRTIRGSASGLCGPVFDSHERTFSTASSGDTGSRGLPCLSPEQAREHFLDFPAGEMQSTMNLHSAAEDAVGLTLIIAMARHYKTTNLDPVDAMRE
jgi:hypothetical protein